MPNDRLGTEAVVCARGPDRPWYGPMRAMRKPSGVEGRAAGLTPGGGDVYVLSGIRDSGLHKGWLGQNENPGFVVFLS